MPGSTVGVADLVEIVGLPLPKDRIKGLGGPRNRAGSDLTCHLRLLWILCQSRQVTPGRLHDGVAGEKQVPALTERPADLLLRPVRDEFHIVFEGTDMPLGVDQRLHRVRIEKEVLVLRADDVRPCQSKEVKNPCSLTLA